VVDEATPRSLRAVRFRWRARFGFFLRAEAPVVGLGYPIPPRTAVLGLLANVLGLEKDRLATELADARVALSGRCPPTHWHACNLRKIKSTRFLPASFSAKKPVELLFSEESNTQSRQEWLCDPDFEVIAALPDTLHDRLASRLREGRTHFTPCMGLSEMLASVEHLADETLTPLAAGLHRVHTAVLQEGDTKLVVRAVLDEQLRVLSLTLPRAVSEDRRFSHANYLVAPEGDALPIHTASAWQSSTGPVTFL
jgi:CRISPR-associated protein Cas5h